MVIELRIKNFLSFKEETTISFEASKDTFKHSSISFGFGNVKPMIRMPQLV